MDWTLILAYLSAHFMSPHKKEDLKKIKNTLKVKMAANMTASKMKTTSKAKMTPKMKMTMGGGMKIIIVSNQFKVCYITIFRDMFIHTLFKDASFYTFFFKLFSNTLEPH